MDESTNGETIRRMFDLFEAREWDRAAETMHEDLEVDWPHTGERFRGRDNYIGMNAAYPEGWSIQVRRIVAQGDQVVSEIYVTHPDGNAYAASFFVLLDGWISRIVEYWVDEHHQEPPEWRARFTDPG